MIIIEKLNETLILCVLCNFALLYNTLNKYYPHFLSLYVENAKNVFNNFINMLNESIPRYEGKE